ncbi:hypothetical protein XENTR_v10014312 [Xenopus tropicalis]|uniref:Kelch repeat and BTB (POZ) domain containing 11 n=1 Tax=Xenopus tropicalis TaxID=8364 RepID=A0A803J1Z1_XENTR|nr:kelch repeat and BTB domain-containing protein 11 [Xenopus tropicalis]KAE8603350.1 hypothetical protein XENTR_v10014312 [Xenopus tropicalis]|eukprot:XP_004914544.1 PREDICTED: kelch repeat and BTB domain-containing protein 11 [Xenopus tropicalis]
MEKPGPSACYPGDLNMNEGGAKKACGTAAAPGATYGQFQHSLRDSAQLAETNGGYSGHQAAMPLISPHSDTDDRSGAELSRESSGLPGGPWDMNNAMSESEEEAEERSLPGSHSGPGHNWGDLVGAAEPPGGQGGSSPAEPPDLDIEVTGGQRIRAHKSVLAEKSDYFRARMSRDILKIKGLSYQTLRLLVDYIYSGRLEVGQDNVVEVISGAKFLQMPCAVQCAMDSMRSQICLRNCYQVLHIAKKQRLTELREAAYKFMSDNFLQVLREPTVYGRLTGSERELILQRRLDGKHCLVVAELNDAFERLSSSSRPQSRESSRPQSPSSVVSLEEDATTYQVQFYSESGGGWKALTRLPEEANSKGCGVCVLYNYLFIAGGIRGSGDKAKLSDQVFCYNPLTDSWEKLRAMSQPRSQLKLLALDGYLYAIGGECLFTVEKYDPRLDRWTTIAPIPKGAFAVAHEATTCNGEIYVSGGTLFYRLLKYEPKRDEWQECPYNNSRRRSAGMVSYRGCIYRFDISREHGLSVFTYNSMARHWSEGVHLLRPGPGPPHSNMPFRCTVMGSHIYCLNRASALRVPLPPEGTGGEMGSCEAERFPTAEEAKGVLFPFVLSLPDGKQVH